MQEMRRGEEIEESTLDLRVRNGHQAATRAIDTY